MNFKSRLSGIVVGAFFALAASFHAPIAKTAAAEERPYEWSGVSRIVSVGDIHGAYDNLIRVLQNADIVDEDGDWIGGSTHLVQNGDMVDRGPDSRKVMDFLMDLEKQAKKAGGAVHVLIGNHEAMNIVGILDLVSEEEYRSYANSDSRRLRDKAFESYFEGVRREAKEKKARAPSKREARREFEQTYPIGYIEHRQAFARDGRYGRWIRSLNTGIRINEVVFSTVIGASGFPRLVSRKSIDACVKSFLVNSLSRTGSRSTPNPRSSIAVWQTRGSRRALRSWPFRSSSELSRTCLPREWWSGTRSRPA